MTTIDKLKELALSASGGPWELRVHTSGFYDFNPMQDDWSIVDNCGKVVAWERDAILRQEDVRYVAAAHPAAVLELIAEVERLRKDAARYRLIRNYYPALLLDMLEDRPKPDDAFAEELDAAIDNATGSENK